MRPLSPALHRLLTLAAAPLLLALGGAAVLPWAQGLRAEETARGLQIPPPPTDRADALSQQLSLFILGGLRTMAAEILAMDATEAWISQDWPRARKRWNQITTLCPRRSSYWMRAARDMAKNAVAHTQGRRDLDEHERAVMSRDYLDAAEKFLLTGIAHNPKEVLLRLDLGAFYEDLNRRPQFAKAVEAYQAALDCGASPMNRRWVFYNLCRIRGREEEAWRLGRALFEEERHRSPSLRCLLFVLQNSLPPEQIPAEQRLTPEQIFGSEERAVKHLRRFNRNSLRFPTRGVQEYLDGKEAERTHD